MPAPSLTLVGPGYPWRGGIAHHSAGLAQAFQRAGRPLRWVGFRRLYPPWLYPGRGAALDPSPPPPGGPPAEALLDPLAPATWPAAARALAGPAPGWVLLQYWTPFLAPFYAFLSARLRRLGCRVAFLVHNALPHEPHPWDPALARLALSGADALLAHAPSEAAALAVLLPGARIRVCPHPLPVLPPGPPRSAARERLARRLDRPLPSDETVLLFFGLVRPYKGLDVLLDALALLAEAARPPLLVAAGEFWQPLARYRAQVQRPGLAGRVVLLDGYVPDPAAADLFAAADVFIAPYRSATQSGALKRAMAGGLPLIASAPAVDELARAWPALQTVPPGDPPALARVIQVWTPPPARLPPPDPWPSWERLVEEIIKLEQL